MIEATHEVVVKSKGINTCKVLRTVAALSIVLLLSTIYFSYYYYYFVRVWCLELWQPPCDHEEATLRIKTNSLCMREKKCGKDLNHRWCQLTELNNPRTNLPLNFSLSEIIILLIIGVSLVEFSITCKQKQPNWYMCPKSDFFFFSIFYF